MKKQGVQKTYLIEWWLKIHQVLGGKWSPDS